MCLFQVAFHTLELRDFYSSVKPKQHHAVQRLGVQGKEMLLRSCYKNCFFFWNEFFWMLAFFFFFPFSFCYSANNCWPLQHELKFTVVKAISLPSMAFWVMAAEKALRLLALSFESCDFMWASCSCEMIVLSWLHSESMSETTSWGYPCFHCAIQCVLGFL